MMSKTIAVVLLIEDIERYVEQFKLLVITIRTENKNTPIYAITPTLFRLSKSDILWCHDHDVMYSVHSEYHDTCRGSEMIVHSNIIAAQTMVIASDIVREDMILYIDVDTVCLGKISDIQLGSDNQLYISRINKVISTDDYIDDTLPGYMENFVKTTHKHLKLVKEYKEFSSWPSSWFIYHLRESPFWCEWLDYMSEYNKKVIKSPVIGRYKMTCQIVEQGEESGLLHLMDKYNFTGASSDTCRLSYFDRKRSITRGDTIIYNYGGFHQHAGRIDVDYIKEYIKSNNIGVNSTRTSASELDLGEGYTYRYEYLQVKHGLSD